MSENLKAKPSIQLSVSRTGLLEAFKDIFIWLGTLLLILTFSIACALAFWFIRAKIGDSIAVSYYAYVVWLDSLIFGTIPSLWFQVNLKSDSLDVFFRWVWFTYLYTIIFGGSFIFIIKGEVYRYLTAIIIVLSIALVIHYFVPTQPPWMCVEGVMRIDGERFTDADKNLVAAMPSVHQAVVGVLGLAIWKFGLYGKFFAVTHNVMMAAALAYLGEHFVVDSIAGIILALFSWYITKHIIIMLNKSKP